MLITADDDVIRAALEWCRAHGNYHAHDTKTEVRKGQLCRAEQRLIQAVNAWKNGGA